MAWCKGCSKQIEWHPRVDGKTVSIDPDPHPDGTLAFGPGMKLQLVPRGSRPRCYRYHLSTCKNPDAARRQDHVDDPDPDREDDYPDGT